MNRAILIGRLTKDIEVKVTSSGVGVTQFTIAVDRRFKDADGNRQTDFINCVAWRQTASFLGSYFRKGSKVAIVGNIQTRSYEDNNNQKKYITEVVVEEVYFVESASNNQAQEQTPPLPQQKVNQNTVQEPPQAPPTMIAPDMYAGGLPADDEIELPFEV